MLTENILSEIIISVNKIEEKYCNKNIFSPNIFRYESMKSEKKYFRI